MSLVEAESTLTDKYQTTVPVAVRKALGLSKRDRLLFTVLPNGDITLKKSNTFEEDPSINAFLEFLERDMIQNPQKLTALSKSRVAQWRKLTRGVQINLDEPLND